MSSASDATPPSNPSIAVDRWPEEVLAFEEVFAEEKKCLGEDDKGLRAGIDGDGAADERRRDLAALCLSGGGIRSAAFALGVVTGLARSGVLDGFHYLSTVSGGGYTGSWLSAWIQRANSRSAVINALRWADAKHGHDWDARHPKDAVGSVEPDHPHVLHAVALRRGGRHQHPFPDLGAGGELDAVGARRDPLEAVDRPSRVAARQPLVAQSRHGERELVAREPLGEGVEHEVGVGPITAEVLQLVPERRTRVPPADDGREDRDLGGRVDVDHSPGVDRPRPELDAGHVSLADCPDGHEKPRVTGVEPALVGQHSRIGAQPAVGGGREAGGQFVGADRIGRQANLRRLRFAFLAFKRADRIDQRSAGPDPACRAGEHRGLQFGHFGDLARADAVEHVGMAAAGAGGGAS